MLIDSHAHLSTRKYDDDRNDVLLRCWEHGLERIVEIGAVSSFEGNESAREIAEAHDPVYFSVGLHPHDAKDFSEEKWSRLVELAQNHPKVVGIGETGFDFFYNHSTQDEQSIVFARHIALAKQVGLPIVIHDRDADKETFDLLLSEGAFNGEGEFHCFSSDWSFAKKIIDRGWYIALGGITTFPNAYEIHDVARQVPLESLLIETDSPFLTPVPHRGKRNEPWMCRFVAERIAELKNIPVEDVIRKTGENAAKLFGLGLHQKD